MDVRGLLGGVLHLRSAVVLICFTRCFVWVPRRQRSQEPVRLLDRSPARRPQRFFADLPPGPSPHPPFRYPTCQVLLSTGLSLLPGKCYSRLAWGPENLIAAACGSMLHFLDARTGEVVERIDEAHDAAVSAAL